jgi:tellurite resistance protein TerC
MMIFYPSLLTAVTSPAEPWTWWVAFNAFILIMIVLDLIVFQRGSHQVGMKEALFWSGFWIVLSLVFGAGVYHILGAEKGLQFLTGYVMEKAMSVDNIFIFILLFGFFKVEPKLQHRVLYWGIIGALIFRALFILAGVALINNFHWIIYVFGALLIWSAWQLLQSDEKQVDPEKNFVLRILKPRMRVTEDFEGANFFVIRDGKRWVTPLFLALLAIETSDILFAVDSIPAVLAISRDPFIVYTSNVFAILGLRALYFALAGVMELFHCLHYGLAVILAFVGVKMLVSGVYEISVLWSLGVIGAVLVVSVVASFIIPPPNKKIA